MWGDCGAPPRTQAAVSPFPAPLLSDRQHLERPAYSQGCLKSRGEPATTGAQPGPRPRPPSSLPAAPAELPPSSARRTPAPSAAGPTRPPTSPPARPSTRPDGFRAPPRRPRDGGGAKSAAHLRAGSRAARRGAGRGRARPADSNFVALGTAQSSLPRGAGGAAQALTQQLARWRAGPCSHPPAGALGASGAVSRAPRLGCREERAAVRQAWTPLRKACASWVVSALKCSRACPPAGSGRWCWGSGAPRELGFQEKHTQPTNKAVGEGGGKVFSSVLS